MSKRTQCTGFESAFIKSYKGWDLMDTAVFGFYDVEFKDGFLPEDFTLPKEPSLEVDLDKLRVYVYGEESEPVFERPFTLAW